MVDFLKQQNQSRKGSSSDTSESSKVMHPTLKLQTTIGNQAVLRTLQLPKQYPAPNHSVSFKGTSRWAPGLKSPLWAGSAEVEQALDDKLASIGIGAAGDYVGRIQQALVILGYPLLRFGIDLRFGGETKAAVLSFQRDHQLRDDGLVGPETLARMDGLLTSLPTSPAKYHWNPKSQQVATPQLPAVATYGRVPPSPPVADDFSPNHEFFEILAHEVAYLNGLDFQYLYRQPAPAIELTHSPTGLKGNFAILSSEPEVLPPNKALYYQVREMEGADPLNKEHGLAALYLIPFNKPDAPAILVFRGTEGAVADILADADKEGPGASAFAKAAKHIKATLDGLKGRKVVVTGHSLGGAIAQLTTAMFPGLVSECITFNSPGISDKALQTFAKGSAGSGVSPKIAHYLTRGDIVSTVGPTRLPGQVTMMYSAASRKLATMYADGKKIELAERAISRLYLWITLIAAGEPAYSPIMAPIWDTLANFDELKALVDFREVFAEIHGEVLIPISVPIGAKGVGKTAWRSHPPVEQISVPEIERERVTLGEASIVLLEFFDKTLPEIMVSVLPNPLAASAQKVQPILGALVQALKRLGGLRGLVGKALYIDSKTGQMSFWLSELVVTDKEAK